MRIEAKEAARRVALKETMRRAYPTVQRNNFLDHGLDIEIEVSGEHAEDVKFQYIFASDVLARRFQTSGILAELKALGFKEARLIGGQAYFTYWDLSKE